MSRKPVVGDLGRVRLGLRLLDVHLVEPFPYRAPARLDEIRRLEQVRCRELVDAHVEVGRRLDERSML